ncbi:MAG: hypothetical protein M3347_15745 [Armatimonadota bacterium]|nr:hypothetical protein [Armatimonadota bacterium]
MLIQSTAQKYSTKAHDDLLAQWDAVRFEAGPLTLDLTQVCFIDPYGMCGLVLFINHLPEEALPVRLLLSGWPAQNQSKSPQTLNDLPAGPVKYLTRMGFWELVEQKLDVKRGQIPICPPWLAERNVLLDLTVLHSHDAISVMLRKTGNLLQNIGYTVPGRGHVLEVLSELCSNVLLHAQTEFGGVAAMQTYRNKEDVRYLVMSIGDAGIGVRRSLASNSALAGRLQSDAQALGVAVQPGASRFAAGGHGGGLPRVLEIARRYGGTVALRSGSGALAYNGADDQRRSFDAPPLLGTQLRVALPESKLRQTSPAAGSG